jgi:hypothetical protein
MMCLRIAGRGWLHAAPLLIVLGMLGCGRYAPVHGTVTLDDGTPVTNGMVVFESKDAAKPVSARGDIQSDGSYQLSTDQPGDGVPPGWYRVLVAPPPQHPDGPPIKYIFDKKYSAFATSGLEFEVKSGSNEYPIRLSKAGAGH